MPTPPKAPESLETPNLPDFTDRLPDLVAAIRTTAQDLAQAKEVESYLPYWEDLYIVVHSMKGALSILEAPKDMVDFILHFFEVMNDAFTGPYIVRDKKGASQIFSNIAEFLEHPDLKQHDVSTLKEKLDQLKSGMILDMESGERLKAMPGHLFYVSDIVSKKAREVKLLHFNDCVVEDSILLDQIPFWREHLKEALRFPEFGRGLMVNFLPFLSPEGSRAVKVWAWVAAASSSRAVLKQRIKDIMPKVSITKV